MIEIESEKVARVVTPREGGYPTLLFTNVIGVLGEESFRMLEKICKPLLLD